MSSREVSREAALQKKTCGSLWTPSWTNNVPLWQRQPAVSWGTLEEALPGGWGRWSFLCSLHWWGHTWSTVSSLGLPSTSEIWSYWRESSKGPWRWLRDWSISPMRKGRESSDCAAWKREDLRAASSSMCKNIWREGVKKMEPGYFQWCPVTGAQAVGTHWNAGGSVWTSGNTFLLCERLTTGMGCPERLRSLHPWRYSKATGHGPGQPALGGPAWAWGLDKMASRGPFQPQPFRNPVILWVLCIINADVW